MFLHQNQPRRLKLPPLSPASVRTFLFFSLLLEPIILSHPLHPCLYQWSTTASLVFFFIAVKSAQPSNILSFARFFIRVRLAILSSSPALAIFIGLLGVTVIAEAALVFGRAATPLLIVGAALGIPGAIAIMRAFRAQFDLIREKLKDPTNFEAAVQRTATTFTIGALFCSRLCGFFIGVSLIPLAGATVASLLGSICSLSLISSYSNTNASTRPISYDRSPP